jgi:glycosyltransferase involved in cell wall biosynthesis
MNCATGVRNGRVTVVIPSFNRAALLPRAVDSVLKQTVADLCDIVVVDDGSTDGTNTVVAGYGVRVHYIWQPNSGAAAARNAAIRASDNEFVAFLDTDDEWLPDTTERQLSVMRRWPEVVLVAGRGVERYTDGRTIPHRVPRIPLDQPTDFAPALFDQNIMSTPSVMVRRRVLEQTGLFCEDLPRSHDYHMWVRLACRGPCVFLDAPVAIYAADTPDGLQGDRDAALHANVRARYLLKRELRRRPDCRAIWRRALARKLATLRDRCYGERRYIQAARFGFESLWHRPWSRPQWEWGRAFSALGCGVLSRRASVAPRATRAAGFSLRRSPESAAPAVQHGQAPTPSEPAHGTRPSAGKPRLRRSLAMAPGVAQDGVQAGPTTEPGAMLRSGHEQSGRVTVVMPTYNRAALLPNAIQSALSQTVAHLCDIVVVDDGSTDNTRNVVAAFEARVRYVYQPNAGLAAARNTGIRASGDEYVAFLDDDDEWEPDKIEQQLDAFRRWPEAVLVAGRATARYADGRTKPHPLPPIPLDKPTDFAPWLFENNFLSVPMVLVRRRCLERAGLHRAELRRRQDYHLWVRLACLGPCVYLDAPVATYAADTPRSLSEDQMAAMRANLHVRRLLKRELCHRPDCLGNWRRGMAHCLAILRDLSYRNGRFAEAARFGFQSLLYRPWPRPKWEWGRLLSSLRRAAVLDLRSDALADKPAAV